MLRQVGQAMAENAQKSEMDFRVFSCSASQAGNRFFHDTDSGTVLFAQRSGVVGIAEQAGIVSHDEGGEDIQKLLFFQIVVVTDTPGGKALVINLRKAHHTIAEVGHGMLFGVLLQ